MRCLAADPDARPRSAAALAHELAATLPGAARSPPRPPVTAATEIKRAPVRRSKKLRPALALAALAVGAIAGGGIALVATSGGRHPQLLRSPRVAPVPHGSTPQQQAQNLAAWLARYSG